MFSNNTVIQMAISSVLLWALILGTPTLSLAQGKSVEKREQKEEKKEQKEERKEERVQAKLTVNINDDDDENDSDDDDKGCLRAVGHLIAPGWIKHNGQLTIDEECVLPFGISKKINGTGTTTPPGDDDDEDEDDESDITAPIISLITVRTTKNQAVVRWSTNERANGTVFYSTSTPVATSTAGAQAVANNALTFNHQLVIPGLTASTTYHAIIRSQDDAGNTTWSNTFSFNTKSDLFIDFTAPIISDTVTTVGTSTINVSWKTNESATSQLFYSTSSPIIIGGVNTGVANDLTLKLNHNLTISGLATGTPYYLLIRTQDAAGNTRLSDTFSTTTTSL